MDVEVATVAGWEDNSISISYPVLERLAYAALKVPIAVFYFPNPPAVEEPESKFRRLPEFELERFSPDLFEKVRLAQAYQESVEELVDGTGQTGRISPLLDSAKRARTPEEMAKLVRRNLGIGPAGTLRFDSSEAAFKAWRHSLEQNGIYTFKDHIDDRFVSGFCLYDDAYPIIFINNATAFARQLFTLAHELGHILYNVNGVTDVTDEYVDYMDDANRRLEVACNRFAAELLLPDAEFDADAKRFRNEGPEIIPQLAEKYSVSREVILRRLLERRLVTAEFYRQKSREWNQEYARRGKRAQGGGNFYLTKIAYLGEGFVRLAFQRHRAGQLNRQQLGTHLNINSRHLGKMETWLR